MSDIDANRLLLELEKRRRDVNREIMNPEVETLRVDDLMPAVTLAAHARAAYVSEMLSLARSASSLPDYEQIESLARARATYEELRTAVNALETAIERGYLDVAGA